MTFDELGKKKNKTEAECLLLQGICALSVTNEYSNKTPWEIFEHLSKTCQDW